MNYEFKTSLSWLYVLALVGECYFGLSYPDVCMHFSVSDEASQSCNAQPFA